MAKNEVTTVKETNPVVAPSADLMVEVAQEDMIIPFLKVIQSLSEEVMPGKDKYNPDVRPGDIYDGATKTIFKDAKVLVCGLKKYYTEWTPEVRGKIVGKHLANSDVVLTAVRTEKKTEKGNVFYDLSTPDGNQLVETYGVVMIIKNGDGTVIPGVLTLSKTSFMVGKQLSTMLNLKQHQGVPVFAMGTTSVSNSKGSWFKPMFTFAEYETDPEIIDTFRSMMGCVDAILFKNDGDPDAAPAKADDDDDTLF